jgi:opacity protein-like surface antigen
MKRLFLGSAMLAALLVGPALAADMPVKARPLPPPPCPAAQFAGGYIGINGGFVNWTANRTDLDGAVNSDFTLIQHKWGGTVGGQIGYNWTTCNTLWGIELDGNIVLRICDGERVALGDSAMIEASAVSNALAHSPVRIAATFASVHIDVLKIAVVIASSNAR